MVCRPDPPTDQTTVANLLDSFLGDKEARLKTGDIKQDTFKHYVRVRDTINEAMGKRPVTTLGPDDFMALRAKLAGCSPHTLKRRLTIAATRKQRHTAKRIWERLRDEHGFNGCYTIVKDVVREWKLAHREVFLPLTHPPGEAQVDFGEATVKLAGEPTKVALFVMTHSRGKTWMKIAPE